MGKKNLNTVNRLRFLKLNEERKLKIEQASDAALPKQFPVNKLSAELHPEKQYVTVAEIREWDENCKSFTFIADPSKGTKQLAYFKAGAYLSVSLEVDGMKITRPYSISSSPKEALEGTYTLTVKRVPGGIGSNYMLDHFKVGDQVTLSSPLGEFVYLPIRDGKTVIGVAGGSGITPFHSFAKAIADGDEEKTGYEHGFVTADLIKKKLPQGYFDLVAVITFYRVVFSRLSYRLYYFLYIFFS